MTSNSLQVALRPLRSGSLNAEVSPKKSARVLFRDGWAEQLPVRLGDRTQGFDHPELLRRLDTLDQHGHAELRLIAEGRGSSIRKIDNFLPSWLGLDIVFQKD